MMCGPPEYDMEDMNRFYEQPEWLTAERAKEADLTKARAQVVLWTEAVAWIRSDLPETTQQDIRRSIQADPENWVLPYHFNWGMAMRNGLREHAYGETDFEVGNLDNIYTELVEEAVMTDRSEPIITKDSDRWGPIRYFLDSDGDDHWYVIEEDRRAEWDKWRDIVDPDDERAWEIPPYARSLGGSYTCVTFTDPRTS